MADTKSLTKKEIKKIVAWLQSKKANIQGCPSCGQHNFSVVEQLGVITLKDVGGKIRLGSNAPCILTVCTNCAHIMLFSALMMGIEKKEPNSEVDSSEKEEIDVES